MIYPNNTKTIANFILLQWWFFVSLNIIYNNISYHNIIDKKTFLGQLYMCHISQAFFLLSD